MLSYRQVFALLWLIVFLAGCGSLSRAPVPVHIEIDSGTRHLETNAETVRQVLAEAGIVLGNLDRVNPDLNRSIRPDMTIRVIRVAEETESETISIPFERRIMVNEALPPGEQRLAQLGQNGQEEIVTKITYENGREVSRVQLSKTVVQEAVEEILVVGAEQESESISFEGVIAYLSGGNAWLMRGNNTTRRPVTTEGDLDGRVFDLNPDGSKLLYTRTVTDVIDAPLNELWMVETRIVGEAPISLPIQGIIYAEWSPVPTETIIAYSTAERVPSQPGWRANNDLWLWDTSKDIDQAEEIVPANTSGLYAWWGATYAWSPDGNSFAYANPGQVGVIDILSKTVTTLKEFAPYETNSDWAWAPTVSWSPDGRFIATVIHGEPLENEAPAESSPVFDVWLLSKDGQIKVKAWEQAGMWSNPVWHSRGVAFGRAINPLSSVDSRYKIANMDWDGSNATVLFPQSEAPGVTLPETVWQPAGDDLSFVFVNRNNLFYYRGVQSPPQPLTADDQSYRPQWVLPVNNTPILAGAGSFSPTIKPATVITSGLTITATPPITP